MKNNLFNPLYHFIQLTMLSGHSCYNMHNIAVFRKMNLQSCFNISFNI